MEIKLTLGGGTIKPAGVAIMNVATKVSSHSFPAYHHPHHHPLPIYISTNSFSYPVLLLSIHPPHRRTPQNVSKGL